MKKILLLLLLFTGIVNGQIGLNNPTDLIVCGYNSPNSELILLLDKKNEIFGTLNQVEYEIFYYFNQIDAQSDINRNDFESINISTNLTIYIRVIEINNTNNFELTSLNFIKYSIPIANTVSNLFIEDIPFDGLANFNLDTQSAIITGGQINTSISYFSNLNDAYLNQNNITNSNNYSNLSNPQKIYARITNIISGCNLVIDFNLIVTNPNIITITDPVFKNLLLHNNPSIGNITFDEQDNPISIDLNLNNEIDINEVNQLKSIQVSSAFIQSFNGLNSFVNLEKFRAFNCTNVLSVNVSDLQQLKEINLNDFLNLTNVQLNNLPNLEVLQIPHNSISNFNLNTITSLKHLNCSRNLLSSLNVDNLINLSTLICDQNQINSLNLNNLLNLISLNCSNNNLTNINYSNNLNLEEIYCSTNNLITLNTVYNINLQYLECSGNPLTSLYLNPNLYNLNCNYTSLVNLDVSYLTNLTVLRCNFNNNLTNLLMKNGKTYNPFVIGNLDISENLSLQYICTDQYNIEPIQQFLIMNNNPNVVVNSYCSFSPGGNFNTISGNIKFDSNNNGCDSNDLTQPNIRLNINDGTNTGASFSNNLGNYSFFTQPGSFDITPDCENPTWFNFSPITTTIPFADNNNNLTTQNFCITANGVHNDLEVVISPITPSRPGFDADYNIVYKNKGNQTLSGDVSLNYDDAVLDFVSSTITPTSTSLGNLSWTYTNLLPFESKSIDVKFNVNSPTETPAINIGDVLNFNVNITPLTGDELPNDNSFNLNQIVVGSFDPNDITCLEGNSVAPSTIGEYLHYAINFENTGNFPAENIVVKTTIDPSKFNINSLQLLNTSNPVDARINGNVVELIFKNIQLGSGGHGHILLKMKSNNILNSGDNVSKRADIFFDYNFPIDTGLAVTVFQNLSNTVFVIDNSVSISPNPTSSKVKINSNNNVKSIEVYDVQGRILQTILNANNLDLSDKTNGIYFLKITTEKGSKIEKVVKE